MKRLKTMRAGRLVRSVVYTAPCRKDPPQARGPRLRISSEAQAKFNLQKSTDKLEALLALNFPEGFWWVTLTYDDAHLPENRDMARKLLKRYIRKLRQAWRLKQRELIYIYCTQEVLDDGSLRLHHHMVCNNCDWDDFDTLRSLWDAGSNVDIQWRNSDDDITDIAVYMTHEPRDHGKPRLGEQTWTPCRGLKRPEVETMDVPDDVTLEAPPGAQTVERDALRNEWGEFSFIKYWLPRWDPVNPPQYGNGKGGTKWTSREKGINTY